MGFFTPVTIFSSLLEGLLQIFCRDLALPRTSATAASSEALFGETRLRFTLGASSSLRAMIDSLSEAYQAFYGGFRPFGLSCRASYRPDR